jgi:hypothetical protein
MIRYTMNKRVGGSGSLNTIQEIEPRPLLMDLLFGWMKERIYEMA